MNKDYNKDHYYTVTTDECKELGGSVVCSGEGTCLCVIPLE